jgi:hypothetical protein
VSSAFQDLTAAVMRRTRLNTRFFAQSIKYKTGAEEIYLDAHVRHDIRMRVNPDTNEEEIIEQLHVELDRAQVTAQPDFGDRILVAGDTQAYLYAFKGKHRPVSWKATFERQRQTRQGV